MEEKNYQDLPVFQKAKQLALHIYRISQTFPKEEQSSLVFLMRRTAILILSYIAQGSLQALPKDSLRFLNSAIGTTTELKVYLEISLALGYLDHKTYEEAESLVTEVLKLIESYKLSLGAKTE